MQVVSTVVPQRPNSNALPNVVASSVMSQLNGTVMPGATLTAKVYPSKRSLTENGAGMGAAGNHPSGSRSCNVPVPRLLCMLRGNAAHTTRRLDFYGVSAMQVFNVT